MLAVLYTAIKYRKDLGILDHYEDGSFGEKAKAEITRRRKELSENGNDTEEIERVGSMGAEIAKFLLTESKILGHIYLLMPCFERTMLS